MDGKPRLTLVAQPQEYFRELLTEAMADLRVATKPETEFYLVNLLNQFMSAENLYTRDDSGEIKEEALALMVKEALEQPEPNTQRALFKRIGDVSLYKAGFFQDSFNRKLVDVDYYIGMGETAYQQVAALAAALQRDIFNELARKFPMLVEVLAEVSEKTAQRSEKDLLRLYEIWVKTRSERAAKALQEAGILPNDTIKKDWQ